MPELPVISGVECMNALAKLGYGIARVRGSHHRLLCPGRPPVTVPLHRELDRGTLRAVIRQAGLTVDELSRCSGRPHAFQCILQVRRQGRLERKLTAVDGVT